MPALAHRRRRAVTWTLPDDAHHLPTLQTVHDALNDLPAHSCPDGTVVDDRPISSYALQLCTPDHAVHNHEAWNHHADLVERMSRVSEGGSPTGSSDASPSKRYYSQAYGRLHRHGLARTVTTNFHNPGSGRFTHYRHPRTLTVREAARLQGIPDSFRFIKYRSWQEQLVGNAFPMLWAEAIGRHVWSEIGPALTSAAAALPQRS
jgi:DNA (cytosine-5)-methyltransferase 1